ncbi:GDP-mannose 4,6-dehydratase [Flavobacterium sp. J372]|uniref:GDP-mannose 4,6-dehydratase n=1 Tax=Flavobacterium sp. J372 TaxID=2898436 RepID=UPI0021517CDB|nr:GDP-mannose 4,6-dehydratase [Flavobacterium sp. J372]MCR5862036.1 GDP-mannose 4,6-dehydratase [Flavobacterium sp. J372]
MENNNIKNTNNFGIVEWFRPGDYTAVEKAITDFKLLGVTHVRTGISWADWYRQGTAEWYDWLFEQLSQVVEILPCFLYTPPSIGEAEKVSSPPKNLKAYADFVDVMITKYGEDFEWVELWNEPNNIIEYDFTMDTSWLKFSEMIGNAAYWAKHRGKKTVLGGMSPIDPNWLQTMAERGVLQYIDAVGIHGFPQTFDQQWTSWDDKLTAVKEVLKRNDINCELWITEAGFSTWQYDEVKQYEEFKKALTIGADRVYWYGLNDLDPQFATIGGFHLDNREYHFGLKKYDGTPKLLYRLLAMGGISEIHSHDYISKQYTVAQNTEKYTLITGGAGFIGTNLAARLLGEGKRVMVYDNLSRPGSEQNLQWLKSEFGDNLIIQVADIREKIILEECVKNAEQVFHFSAQVAVTSSLTNPTHDFEVNIQGTFNILEAIRKSAHQPPMVFTSTNKVYGDLFDLGLTTDETRYQPEDDYFRKNGISEQRALDFHSPYGCSKGSADQYVLDYSRSYGLKTAVFRMSCIYGPHQFGNEDQGWVAHFLIQALEGKPITIYGDGKQVRDILFVEDLVNAFLLAQKNIDKITGTAFNIGGGAKNTVSLVEILSLIRHKTRKDMDISFDEWRTGDQQYYVSDTSAFTKATGWKQKYSVTEGVTALTDWLYESRGVKAKPEVALNTLAV